MRVKTKLTLGVGLLFILIVLVGTVGTVNINALKADTENILVDNYKSLQYARNMLNALDENTQVSRQTVLENMVQQEKNITEIGEQEATEELRYFVEMYQQNPTDRQINLSLRKQIYRIMEVNMDAIYFKSELAKKTANNATFWIMITGSSCFLIAFTLLVNLPANIANPIREITESIKNIAAKKYSERVRFEDHSEFGELAKSFNSMAKKLEEYNNSNLAKIMVEKKRIETLINNMHDPVIGLDEALQIVFVNHEALLILGLQEHDLVGKSAKELAIVNDLVRLLIKDIVQKEVSETSTIKIYANAKESYFEKEYLDITITPTGEEIQQIIGTVIILKNVTQYKELDSAKTSFIATVSHEFKTPISAIKMSLQLLKNDKIGSMNMEQLNLLESINDDATRLLKITGELLNMTQVESGNIQLTVLPIDIREVVSYAIDAVQTQADQKHVRFELQQPPELPNVLIDSEKTAWVLINLLTNAVRYSHDNTTVYLSLTTSGDEVVIQVRDTGQGIASEYLDKIFDRYFRVPGTFKEGTGLGLAISKEFIEAQLGQISVESELGTGCTFTIRLKASL